MVYSKIALTALVAAGSMMTGMLGCENAQPSGDRADIRSTYQNIDKIDQDSWGRAPAPAPKPVAAAPAPAPAPKPAPAPAPAPAPVMAGDCMYLPTGDRASSAVSLCCKMPREVVAGQNFEYEIQVCNLTGQTLGNVMVQYTLEGARIVSSDPAFSGNAFNVGELAPRQCKTIKVTGNAAGVGAVKGCMGATWTNAFCCGTNVVQPALKLVKSVTPAEITPCDSVTYTLTVTNTGTGAASNVKIMDDLTGGQTSDGKSNLAWDIGTLGAGQSQTRTFTTKVSKTGSYTNNARATADNGLTATSNDTSYVVKQAVLQITKACPQMVFLGRPATFKINVTNTGDAPATGVVVTDTMAQGQSFVSASDGGSAAGNVVTWNLGTLAPRASKELTLTSNLSGVGEFCNTARVTAACAIAVEAKCCTKTQGVPDMVTKLDDGDGLPVVGGNHTYSYSMGNQGEIPLTNVQVKIVLPAGLQYVSSDASVSAPVVTGQTLTYNLGTVAARANRAFTFTVKGTQVGEVLVVSDTSCAELRTTVRDEEVTNFVSP